LLEMSGCGAVCFNYKLLLFVFGCYTRTILGVLFPFHCLTNFLYTSRIVTSDVLVYTERECVLFEPFKNEAQTALFKDPVRTAL